MGRKNPKSEWQNDETEDVLGAEDKTVKERCTEERRVKMCIYKSKKEANGHFGREKHQVVSENRKFLLKEVG